MKIANKINYILIQPGYAVFGAGETRSEAIADAQEWIDGSPSIHQIEAALDLGEFILLEQGDDEFESYLETQGGFKKIGGEWFSR